MNRALGVMQGRLLPKYRGHYQAHPVGYWQDEFELAADLGLDYIEFIVDHEDAELNPLLRPGGLAQVLGVVDSSGVGVDAICADYFMEEPLWASASASKILANVLDAASAIGASCVVLPLLETSAIPDAAAQAELVRRVLGVLKAGPPVDIALETELGGDALVRLLDAFDHPVSASPTIPETWRQQDSTWWKTGTRTALGLRMSILKTVRSVGPPACWERETWTSRRCSDEWTWPTTPEGLRYSHTATTQVARSSPTN